MKESKFSILPKRISMLNSIACFGSIPDALVICNMARDCERAGVFVACATDLFF